jgi:serine/threonine-protein kinase
MTDPIARLNAALEGRYRIERELGEGGMATVYLADDLKHERKVALKVLKPELAAVVGAERFLAEIKTTANLQHPHILPLFDSGEADSFLFYVMPYVDGESLREKLDREKQLGVDDALALARKLCDALDYAHSEGVIHRDIKPANILLSKRGEPLVADFGIALAVAQAGGGRITETGLSLGTPHYMSPEQATGDSEVDPRSDVYALACVVYEMLAGEPPFTASTAQAILAKILTMDAPSVTMVRRTVPENVSAAVAKALEKLPADRFSSASDFAKALDDEAFRYAARPITAAGSANTSTRASATFGFAGPSHRDRRSMIAVLLAAAMTAVAAWGWLRPDPTPAPGVPTRAPLTGLDMVVPPGGGWRFAISPDGRSIVAGHAPDLYIRSADDLSWRLLPNTTGATNPIFSPDGQTVAFNANGELFKVPITGGPRLPIVTGGSAHWGVDGTIVYSDDGDLYQVSASGGNPQLLFSSDTLAVSRPHLLPNGRAVVFGTGRGGSSRLTSQIILFDIETGETRTLVASGNHPRYIPTGHLLYGHADQALMAVPFDLETLAVTGTPVTLLPELSVFGGGASQFAVSETGTLVYDRSDDTPADARFVEVTLDGVETPLPLAPGNLEWPRYSPDGRQVAYEDGGEVRIYNVVSGANPVFAGPPSRRPVWSRSGVDLFYQTGPLGSATNFRRVAGGSDAAHPLLGGEGHSLLDIARGDSIAIGFTSRGPMNPDLSVIRLTGDSASLEPFLAAEWDEVGADISPDGRWVAYDSNESGEPRVYVHSFPVLTGRHSISPGGGTDPVWAPDGRTIYYRSGAGFYAVDVSTEPTFTFGAPRLLFEEAAYTAITSAGWGRNWDIHPDGDRFLMVRSAVEGTDVDPAQASGRRLTDVIIVTNWFTELRGRMGEGS